MLRRALNRFFWTTYDHIGRLLAVNACVAAILFTPLAFIEPTPWAVGWALAWIAVGHAIFQTAMSGYALEMRRFHDPGWGVFWRKVRELWLKGLAAHALILILAAALVVNIRFWLHPPLRPEMLKWPGVVVAGVCSWALALLGLAYLHFLPALAEEGAGVFKSGKRAMLLALDNVGTTVGAAVVLLGVGLALAVSVAGVFLLGSTVLATMSASLYTTVLYKYDRLEKERLRAEAEAEGKAATSWKEILDRGGTLPGADPGNEDVDEDGEPRRSLKELWRPWEN